ncbi:hypothetical protein EST38_g5523 [Candolleomyces aberdarensis]|uniref:Protein kinase domain-containing protein n=1 Tax=Candolleomyces aberdarensis TaxID=2316362 RepID=A0A4Q2DK64_9AGAR|nr:hypothetical protein EST38_g5523 [Candolleomyces aberdarensis]
MPSAHGHKHSDSVNQNRKAQLANAYNELGKELSSSKLRVVGNYTLGKVIGEGAYGKVRLGTHRLTSTRVAIKQIPKAMSASLTREIHHHRQLHHPHVTQMYEVIATESAIWIVTELCSGGELFDYLVEKERLPEDEGKIIFGQLCLAVAYLHDNGIVHRDLKLENVLLDERCRVKLGDFGFTREYERGNYMETFCGTTGYAAPEMLQGRKYQGPEVDVWSLGIILYCLLTGTLPFDDDDEEVMRQKVINDGFEDPSWLSLESRDLLQNILQKDVTKRYTIPQILAHPWFTVKELTYEPESPIYADSQLLQVPRSSTPENQPDNSDNPELSEESAQDHEPPFPKDQDNGSSAPTTPDQSISDPFDSTDNAATKGNLSIHQNPSNATIRRTSLSDIESLSSRLTRQPETVPEEDIPESKSLRIRPVSWSNSSGSKAPPSKIRTPARTKRRSVSSLLSENVLGDLERTPTPLPPSTSHQDFVALLSTPTPIIFSTPLERELLNNLSNMGMDTAQIVHSVLSDACDSTGATWWMLKKKAEKKELEEGTMERLTSPIDTDVPRGRKSGSNSNDEVSSGSPRPSKFKRHKVNAGVQTDNAQYAQALRPTPQLAFVPATPTFVRPTTPPPRPMSPTRSPMLSPTPSVINGELSSRSHPSTPGSSMKEKDGSKGRKNRAGSVSIMQRATTALEAAGLVRKKSTEAVREEKERVKELERRGTSGEESRSSHSHDTRGSHGGQSNKLTKSPPLKAQKDNNAPSTPPPSDGHGASQTIGSPWVLADPRDGTALAAVNVRGEMLHSHSAPNLDTAAASTPKASNTNRNRANILTSLRLWFVDGDRKGKRKADTSPRLPMTPQTGYNTRNVGGSGSAKRRGSNASNKFVGRSNVTTSGHRAKRPSMSSRRSSSVNSRRSSVASMQIPILDSPQQLSALRTMGGGSHTPNSERDHSSRPSSVHSFTMQPTTTAKHRKSPSASSSGSLHLRAASPMQQGRYHRRAGSGSSTTRVVRQPVARPPHARSNSATSSLYSPPSSRPTSFYEPSENEGVGGVGGSRNASPLRSRKRSNESGSARRGVVGSTFIAQKRSGPLMSPAFGSGGTFGKSSWKKSWGLEPPGWQSRSTHLPVVEVLAIAPANEPMTLRDVFSGRQSFSAAGDESDWVDEDDDIPAFAGGLGQMGITSSISSSSGASGIGPLNSEPILTLSPAPRGHRSSSTSSSSSSSKRNGSGSAGGKGAGVAGGSGTRGKQGHSPAERHSPLPPEIPMSSEARTGRWQLPAARSGPAFKHAIQEEDEDEEEE